MENTILKQERKVGVAGGFINQIMGNNSSTPIVGEGATILHYSDRSAYEVIEVSNEGMSCTIRKMDCNFIGSSYGDERYTYKSNKENEKMNLEWNSKKSSWGVVYYSIEIIKSLVKKYNKEHGWGGTDVLLASKGLQLDDLFDKTQNIDTYHKSMKIIKGLTKEYRNFNPISIIFGLMEEYRDPSF
jgi:hypothetical protein